MKQRPCVLTIAGSDSGAGAGIQADARTIQALGGYALTAITAVTAQNTRRVTAWRTVQPALVAAQITAVSKDFKIGAMKIGLLSGVAAIRATAKALTAGPRLPLVIDPVIGSTSGTRFLSTRGVSALKRSLFPLATLVTPNWPEAEALTGIRIRKFTDVEAAARCLLATGCQSVLIKGGHGPGPVCRDCLVTAKGRVRWYESLRIKTRNTHGTGCVLSAAIATRLAQGRSLETAIGDARKFLRRGLVGGRKLVLGSGRGPAFAG